MDGLSVEMLPAGDGDGLWIEWGPNGDRHRMIIDGGRSSQVEPLRSRLEALPLDDNRIDLLVITHIDADHIGAPIALLLDPVPGIVFDDVWFNDYHQLGPSSRGAIQGEDLGALLGYRKMDWNKAFGGAAVVVDDQSKPPQRLLPGGLNLVLLSPTRPKLQNLAKKWAKSLGPDKEPGDREAALKRLEKRLKDPEEPEEREATRGAKPRWGKDASEANGSSIAFVAEYEDQRWLFAGDAHTDVLIDGLSGYCAGNGERVRLDGFKISHHGSMNNISPELLDKIDCDRFLISTNGGHDLPDQECIQLIVDKVKTPQLEFNYRTRFTQDWERAEGVTATYLYDENGARTTASQFDQITTSEPESSVPPKVATTVLPPVPTELEETSATSPAAAESESTTNTKKKLRIEVMWGDITKAPGDVLSVGHYAGVLPQQAELSMEVLVSDVENPHRIVKDRNENPDEYEKLLITAMTRRNMISGRLGAITFLPIRAGAGRLIAVCGMGSVGSFSSSKLRLLYRNLAWSLITLPDERTLGTVLIGAGVAGAGTQETLRAMVDGFGDALRSDESARDTFKVRIVELTKEKAEQIHAELLQMQTDKSLPIDLEVEAELCTGDGRRASPQYAVGVIIDAISKLRPKKNRPLEEVLAKIAPEEL